MKTIADMTTPEMLAEYNALTGKSAGKFKSRADGERLLAKARSSVSATSAVAASGAKPKFKTTRTAPPKEGAPVTNDEPNEESSMTENTSTTKAESGPVSDDLPDEYFDNTKPAEEAKQKKDRKPKEPKPPADPAETAKLRSASTRESWSKPGVHEARRKRDGVEVEGVKYKSVRDAFKALGLPDSKHVPFRKKLKAAGALGFEHEGKTTQFKIVKLEKAPKVKKEKKAKDAASSTDAASPSA